MGKLRIFLQFAIVCLSISISACDDETGQNGGSADEILLTIENETFTISQAPSPDNADKSIEILPMEDFDAPIDFDDIFILDDQIIKVGSTIYIPVFCNGLYDEYLYDTKTKSGVYMSGATSLVEEYSDLIAEIQECRQPFYLDKIVSINEDLSAAVIRKSSSFGYTDGKYLSGEYYVLDFASGDCTYICDSYPNYTDTIPGTRIESIEWEDNSSVVIYTYDSSDEFRIFNANKDGDMWTVTAENGQAR